MFTYMYKCSNCKKEKDINFFINEKGKTLKTCIECSKISKDWKDKNKERISLYNKNYNEEKRDNTEVFFIYAKKKNSNEEWQQFNSQLELATKLNLYAANVSKVIKGELKTTGGYEIKVEKEIYKSKAIDWNKIKEENNITEKCKGQPSNKRILHETINNIQGKNCCNCKEWQPLTEYNYCKNHWDKLRNECKKCLSKYRKENRKEISRKYLEYEKERKKKDPQFKLVKTLRSRLGSALKSKKAKKSNNTMELIGCTIPFLIGYLRAQFKEGMTWENHGEWHIDHIKPCSSFNLIDEEEQKKCFHYTNLQPLWKKENLSKSNKIAL